MKERTLGGKCTREGRAGREEYNKGKDGEGSI